MICKKDIILWFKELESYKRIDMMCTLLNMCLPFELRFLGTCLEELGRRDSQELRGIELRVNNAQDLATDMLACQKGEPTDKKIRRKMALYLALIRVCSRACVAEIFRTLDGWGDRDFDSVNDLDTLQELLLVYTMAANHPVFSFEQHMKCTDIFERIKKNSLVCDQQQTTLPHMQMEQSQHATDLRQHLALPPSHQEILHQQQQALHAMHMSAAHTQLLSSTPMQVLPQGSMPINFPQNTHLPKLLQTDGNLQHSITIDGIPHMLTPNMSIPVDSNAILAHPNAAAWGTLRTYPQQAVNMDNPPQSSSPMLSHQSSPASSRTTSPNRTTNTNLMQQQQPPLRTVSKFVSMKNMRRPSTETTPPPTTQQQQHQQQQQQQQLAHEQISNEINLPPQNLKHLNEVIINNEGSGTQLQTLIRNGFTRAGHHARLKTGTYIHTHQQQQQPQPQPQQQSTNPQHFGTGNYALNFSMQNMHMSDGSGGMNMHSSLDTGVNSNKSATGSDSSSSIGSSSEISPPETPTQGNIGYRLNSETQKTHHQQQQQQQSQHSYIKTTNLSARLNGRTNDKTATTSGNASTMVFTQQTANALNNAHSVQQQQQSQQLFGTTEMLLATAVANNNNTTATGNANTIANVSGNGNTLLLTTPATVSGNTVLLQHSHQQQYNVAAAANYAFHAGATAPPSNHLPPTTVVRPPPMTLAHNPALAPPPPPPTQAHGAFHYQMPPPANGELIFANYAFLPGAAPPPVANTVGLRNATNVNTNVNAVTQQLLQHQQPPSTAPPPLTTQSTVPAAAGTVPNATLLTAPHYGTLTVGVGVSINKPLSCYNCGSQSHSGRDCQEISMDDVTRNANYKLNYSVVTSVASANTSPTTTTSSSSNTANSIGSTGSVTTADAVVTHKHNALENSSSSSVNTSASGSGSGSGSSSSSATITTAASAVASAAIAK